MTIFFRVKLTLLALTFSALSMAGIVKKTDAFTGAFSVVTDPLKIDNGCNGFFDCLANSNQYEASISGFMNREKTIVSHCIVINFEGENWAFFDAAHDQSGAVVPVMVIKRQIGRQWANGGVTELVCVKVSRPYLETAAVQGVKLRLEGKNRNFVISLPPIFFIDYLAVTAEWPLVNQPNVRRVILGIQFNAVTREQVPELPNGAASGLRIASVAPFGLAETSGLRVGDVITSVDQSDPPEATKLAEIAQSWTTTKPGKLTVLRGSTVLDIEISPR